MLVLVVDGDLADYFEFSVDQQSIIYAFLEVPQTANFDLIIFNSEIVEIYSSMNAEAGSDENIHGKKYRGAEDPCPGIEE